VCTIPSLDAKVLYYFIFPILNSFSCDFEELPDAPMWLRLPKE
jgi:hypothetical protein